MEKQFKVQIFSPNGVFWTYIGAHTKCTAFMIAREMYPNCTVAAIKEC